MRLKCQLLLLLAASASTVPAYAVDGLISGDELSEMRYACFGDDAEAMTGSRKLTNDACARWDEMMAKARNAGLCLDEQDNSWKPCT